MSTDDPHDERSGVPPEDAPPGGDLPPPPPGQGGAPGAGWQQRDGRESPVNALWGLWFLLPLIGNIVWYVKVQSALNDFWIGKGAQPA